MASPDWIIDGLPDETQELLRAYVNEVQAAYGERLISVILYGSAVRGDFLSGRSNLNILLVVSSCDVDALRQYNSLHKRWGKEQIVIPLFMAEDDVRSTASVFPLEFLEIQECHRLLWGRDPFVGAQVGVERLAGETLASLRSNLLRVRQRFVEGGATEEAATILLPLSITALLPALRGVQRASARPVPSRPEPLFTELEITLGCDCSGLSDAFLLKRGQISPGQKEVPRLLERYLECLEQVVQKAEARLRPSKG